MLMLCKDLRIAPMRSFLTGFSMFIGIVAVILSVLLGTLGRDYLIATNEQLCGRRPTYAINIESQNFSHNKLFDKLVSNISSANVDSAIIMHASNDITLSPAFSTNYGSLRDELIRINEFRHLDTVYTTSGYSRIYNLPIVQGRWLKDGVHDNSLEMVVNKAASHQYPQGNIVFMSSDTGITRMVPMIIVGVVNDGQSSARAYVNLLGMMRFAPQIWQSSDQATIYWLNKKGLSENELKSYFSDLLYDNGGGKVNSVVRHDNNDDYETVINVLQLGFAACAALLLFVSALGLINIGLASLEQRTHELLIRRALGARRWSIAALVLGGALFLALIVSVLAIAISYAIVALIPCFLAPDSPVRSPIYPYQAAIIAVVAALVTALIGSVIPAVKASHLQPALALR